MFLEVGNAQVAFIWVSSIETHIYRQNYAYKHTSTYFEFLYSNRYTPNNRKLKTYIT